MECPQCQSTSYRKNGHRHGKQNYLCKNCGRQFSETSANLLSMTPLTTVEVSPDPIVESSVEENYPELILNGQENQAVLPGSETGISVLLLDAENLKIDVNMERFILGISQHNQVIKIAFANWKNQSMGKQDADLHDRGYQLIHVPGGKNSADGKMIAFGASIFKPYPHVKEVFICSSDGLLIHLCNELQHHGLMVYWLRRKDDKLIIENRNTGEIKYYSIPLNHEIPPLDTLMRQLEYLLQLEQESINERIAKLSTFTALFEARSKIVKQDNYSLTEGIAELTDNSAIQATGNNEAASLINELSSLIEVKEAKSKLFNTRDKIEKAMIEIIKKMMIKGANTEISPTTLSKEFSDIYGQHPSSVIKQLGLGSTLTKFLKTCTCFKIHKKGNQYKIELAQAANKK